MVKQAAKNKGVVRWRKVPRVAVVVSLFNQDISLLLLGGCIKALRAAGVGERHTKVFNVAGAFEVPLVAKKLAGTKKYSGIIALGCVIRGDTPHFEFVSLAATLGCLQAGLDTLCPVAFGVLTVNNRDQAVERASDNEFNKGREAALALLDTLSVLETI